MSSRPSDLASACSWNAAQAPCNSRPQPYLSRVPIFFFSPDCASLGDKLSRARSVAFIINSIFSEEINVPAAASSTRRSRTSVAAREQSITHRSRRDGEVVASTCGRGDSLHAAWHTAPLTETVLTVVESRACVVCDSHFAICWFLVFYLCCFSAEIACVTLRNIGKACGGKYYRRTSAVQIAVCLFPAVRPTACGVIAA